MQVFVSRIGFPITQNVDDLLQSHTARTMLANSEFVIMLNQATTDRVKVAELLNISDTQLSYLRYVRQRPDWKLVALYSDEGITATSMEKRTGLLTMLEDARAGKFDMIIVKNLSRLNRNLKDCLSIVYELRKLPHPVGILFETENMFTLDKNIDFTLTVLSLVAEEESHKKSEAMNASYFMRFSQGDYMIHHLRFQLLPLDSRRQHQRRGPAQERRQRFLSVLRLLHQLQVLLVRFFFQRRRPAAVEGDCYRHHLLHHQPQRCEPRSGA